MLTRFASPFLAIVVVALLPACSVLPGTGPKSDAVEGNATAGVRSTAALPYTLIDVSADTIGFLSQPNLITFQGEFPDKRPKPQQVAGVRDVLNISIFEAAPGGLFTPATAAGARPGNFVDLPPQAVDQKGSIYVPYAGEIPAAARTLPEIQQAIKEKRAKEGMDREQVLLAMGRPVNKTRETKEGLELEDWIYGKPPGRITFVTFAGNKVVKVKESYAGLGAEASVPLTPQ